MRSRNYVRLSLPDAEGKDYRVKLEQECQDTAGQKGLGLARRTGVSNSTIQLRKRNWWQADTISGQRELTALPRGRD